MTDGTVRTRSGRTEIRLSRKHGFALASIADRKSGLNWIQEPTRPGLWRLVGIDNEGQSRVIRSCDAQASLLSESDRRISLGFDGSDGLRVQLVVQASPGGIVSWHLAVLNMGRLVEVERLDFPCLAGLALPPGDPELSYLALPVEQGVLVRNPGSAVFGKKEANFRMSGSYPGNYSMQFVAYGSRGGPGLYLASHDPLGCAKRFTMERDGDGHIVFYIENHFADPALPGTLPYPVAVGTYEGTWLDAARIYGKWALKQGWCSRGKLLPGTAPGWLQSTSAWVWNRGRARYVVSDSIELSEYLGRSAALDWYWWHGNPYDTMLPEYFPPRDGEEAFREAIRRLHERSLRCIVYINGRCCDLASTHFRDGATVRKRTGEVEAETYCKYTGARLAVMCPGTEHWKGVVAGIVSHLIEAGLDGVYIDQIASAPPKACFSASHGHPRGGCLAWAKGNRSLLSAARSAARARNPDAMLCSEGCCEVYIDLLDAFLTLSPSYERMGMFRSLGDSWEPIPMFNSVYHEFVVTFGSYASLDNPPYDELWPPREAVDGADLSQHTDQFDLEIARCLVFGQKPMIANFHPDQLKRARMKESLRFFKEVCLLHESLEDYLVRGRYLGSPDIRVPSFRIRCLSKGIYTLPGQSRTTIRTVPSVLASSWESSDGSIAVVLANVSPQSHRVYLDPLMLGIAGKASLCRIDPRGDACATKQSLGKSLTIRGKHVLGLKTA